MKLRKFTNLGMRGSAHFILPLLAVLVVGVVGTYMLVASHAASNAPSTTFLVYSNARHYKGVKITSDKTFAAARCGKHSLANGGFIKHSLPASTVAKPVPLTAVCIAPTGSHSYTFTFSKDGKTYPKSSPVVVASSTVTAKIGGALPIANACVFLHDYGVNRAPQRVNNSCKTVPPTPSGEADTAATATSATTGGVQAPDATTPAPAAKKTPIISIKTHTLVKTGGALIGVLELPTGDGSTACTGTVNGNALNSAGASVMTFAATLTWDGTHKVCNYAATGVATGVKISAGTYTETVTFAGNDLLNPANHAVLQNIKVN